MIHKAQGVMYDDGVIITIHPHIIFFWPDWDFPVYNEFYKMCLLKGLVWKRYYGDCFNLKYKDEYLDKIVEVLKICFVEIIKWKKLNE